MHTQAQLSSNFLSTLNQFCNRRILVTLILGFTSGLPLALAGATLITWFATTSISVKNIGMLSLIGIPYMLKFLWAPFMDRFVPPFLGRRRGWIIITQIGICGALSFMAFQSPEHNKLLLASLACLLSFSSASQDIAINAYQVDILRENEQVFGAAMYVNGYRAAMLVSGGLALVLAERYSWKATYLIMAGCMVLGMLAALFGPEPEIEVKPPVDLYEAICKSSLEFLSRPKAAWILIFILLYKVGEAFAISLIQPYLLREIHMSLTEIGTLVKGVGFAGVALGTLIGGVITPKLGFYRALLIFGVLHTGSYLAYPFLQPIDATPLAYPFLQLLDATPWVVGIIIFIENITGGLVYAAFLGFMMSLCNRQYSAFQFALFSALGSAGRILMGPYAGMVVDYWGWQSIFGISAALALPGLTVLIYLRNHIQVKN